MRAVAYALTERISWENSDQANGETTRPQFLVARHANWRCLAAFSIALLIVTRPFLVFAGAVSVAVLAGGACSALLNLFLRG